MPTETLDRPKLGSDIDEWLEWQYDKPLPCESPNDCGNTADWRLIKTPCHHDLNYCTECKVKMETWISAVRRQIPRRSLACGKCDADVEVRFIEL